MKMKELFPSKYLKGEDLKDKPIKVTIAEGKLDEMVDGGWKPALYFRNSKPIVLNKTNGDTIAEAYGDDSDQWVGKQIILYFEKNVSYGGKKTGGIRVRIPTDGATKKHEPEPEPEEPEELDEETTDDSDTVPF